MASFENQFDEIQKLSLIPLENFLNRKVATIEKSAYSKVSGLVFTLASKHDKKLYINLVQHIEGYYSRVVTDSLTTLRGEELLREFIRHGENQETIGRFYKNQFEYLGRNYIMRSKSKTFEEIARSSFQAIIYENVKVSITQGLLDIIRVGRNGAVVDKLLVKDTVRFVASLGSRVLQCYEDDFERQFVIDSRQYYNEKSAQWLQTDSVAVFLQKCDRALKAEKEMVLQLLHPMTDTKLQHVLERELLQDKVVQLLERENTGLRSMLENNLLDVIALFYKFITRVGQGMDDFSRILREYIESEGRQLWNTRLGKEQAWSKEIGGDITEDNEMMISLFDLLERLTSMIKVQLHGHVRCQEALKQGFEFIVNYQASGVQAPKKSFIELLAFFCDSLLKKSGERKFNEKECEKLLEQSISVLGFMMDKDMFRNEYQKLLAERLLNQTSASDDLERFVIGRMKLLFGQTFTRHLETMLFDVVNSKEQNDAFQSFLNTKGNNATENKSRAIGDFSVQVLTNGHWPSYQKFERVNLPESMQDAMNLFTTYYVNKHDGKKLIWIHEIGQICINAQWPKSPKPYSIQMVPLQAVVLMLFCSRDRTNTNASLSFQEISTATNLEADTLRRILDSLCFAKFKLLNRDRPVTEGRACKDEDVFSVNSTFSSKSLRFKLLMPVLTVHKSNQNIDKEREHVIEACIVRIMKARKTLPHNELMSDVSAQLQWFRPDLAFIRKRIESLIEREYLERDSNNRTVYNYLA
jgi:cullin 1